MAKSLSKSKPGNLRGCDKPISGRTASVTIEYDHNGKRVTKFFEEAYKARSFYAKKLNEGKNPKVKAFHKESTDESIQEVS